MKNAITGCEITSISNQIFIQKLDAFEFSGDWHDKPLRYKVCGPGKEVQKFSTKRMAASYKSFRAHAKSATEAINNFVRQPN